MRVTTRTVNSAFVLRAPYIEAHVYYMHTTVQVFYTHVGVATKKTSNDCST